MILLDTDTLSLNFTGHSRVTASVRTADEVPAITIVSRIEVLQGRFDAVLKAADGEQLLIAQQRLLTAELDLMKFTVVHFGPAARTEFDVLRQNKKLKKIGRNDLLIASMALAHRAVLVTRNLRHFRQVPGLQLVNWAD